MSVRENGSGAFREISGLVAPAASPPTAGGGHYMIEPGNQVSIAAVLDRDSNAAQRAHLPNSATFDISALPAQRRCVALATTAGPQATEITQA